MKVSDSTNEYGTTVSVHVCDYCHERFTVCPAIPYDKDNDWRGCMSPHCVSYDPSRDADAFIEDDYKDQGILNMTDDEIMDDLIRRGENPDEVVDKTKRIIQEVIADWRKKH